MSFLEDEFFNITFSELKHLNDDDLKQYTSKDAALQICKDSFKSMESPGNEIIRFCVNKLVNIFDGSKFSAGEWQQLIEFFKEILQQLTASSLAAANSSFGTKDSSKLQQQMDTTIEDILCDILDLLKWLHPLVSTLSLTICCSILDFVLDAILLFYNIFRKWKSVLDFSKASKTALILHTFILQVLNEMVEILQIQNTQEFYKLTELLSKLCLLVGQTESVVLKTILETWKCITNLSIACFRVADFDHEEKETSWRFRPLYLLIQEIKRNLSVVHKQETLQQPMEQVEKYLRVTNFYLKLLQRLGNSLKHEYFPCCHEFLEIFLVSNIIPKHLQNSDIHKLIEKYVQIGLTDLFLMIYKNPCITEILLEKYVKKKLEFFVIAKEVLHVIIRDRSLQFIDDKVEIFIKIYQQLMKDAQIFCDSQKYNETIEIFAALAILNGTGKIKQQLRLSVLRKDSFLAQLSVDVLLTISRSSHTDEAETLANFRYWRHCNQKFSLFTDNPRELYVKVLLQHYSTLCQASRSIKEKTLYNDCSEMLLQSSNYRFLMALGLENACQSSKSLSTFSLKISEDLFELLKKWQTDHLSIECYYRMIVCIRLLTQIEPRPSRELLEKIFSLIINILNKSPKDLLRYFAKFFIAALEIIVINLEQFDEANVMDLLQSIQKNQQRIDEVVLILLCILLRKKKRNLHLKQILEDFLQKLQAKTCGELLQWFDMYDNQGTVSQQFENYKINKSLCEQISSLSFRKHNCKESAQIENRQLKRRRLEDETTSNCKGLLNQIHELSRQLTMPDIKFDQEDLNIVNNVIKNLEYCRSRSKS